MTNTAIEPTISQDALLAILEDMVAMHGVRGTGRLLGLSGSYVGSVLQGHEKPGPRLVQALGYAQVETRYRKV